MENEIMKSRIIHLIRHGITKANLNGQYVGVTDIPLCERGRQELKHLKETYSYPQATAFYSSPLSRCVETANILYPDAALNLVEELKECDFGDWEGKTSKELEKNENFIKWLKGGQVGAPPNGENKSDFGKRICTGFEQIVEKLLRTNTESAAVFTHGGVIMSLLSMYGLPEKKFYEWLIANGCGYSIQITPSLWQRDKVFEITEKIPKGNDEKLFGDFKYLMDQAKKLSPEKPKNN
jgi:alpha-ribazole phosphatase